MSDLWVLIEIDHEDPELSYVKNVSTSLDTLLDITQGEGFELDSHSDNYFIYKSVMFYYLSHKITKEEIS